MFSCILSCVLSLYRWGPLAASHLYCNARRVYNPLLARATSHLGEHCGPPLSLDGIQRPALFTGHTHTHTHTHTNNTGDPTHLLPKPNNSPVSPSCALLSCLFVLQVSAPPSQKVSKQRSEVVASHYSQR